MWLLLAVTSAVIFGLAGFGMKVGQMRRVPSSMVLIGLYLSGTCGFLLTWLAGGSPVGYSLLLAGLVIGLGSAGGNFAFMRALETGPASLASPIVNMNVVLVILLSVLAYGEKLGTAKAAGVLFILVAIGLIALRPGGAGGERRSPYWLALVLLSTLLFAVRNGGLKVTQELALDNSAVLFFSYLFPLLYFLFRYRGELAAIGPKGLLPALGWGLISGVGSFGGLQLYAYALSQGPASVISPVFSLYGLVIVLLSVWVYKERLTAMQSLAVALTFVGLLLVRF
ncbi:EamA family transporter [Heliobacterium gestii]|uniref:EamA family transporter n=1 Tax=Heliomicrobium gestii TaxID=2699 RepID=A0A845LDZ3_HELGE|nr:DMT family transporter [Heliomicrobium gestii]MBM7865511.1 drug/metabolite transporter (DMT)-like permease [Heliomicrobium gestii]MZP41763.1 EamA family transporter [Heliomicrobium gestii]